MFQLLPGLIAKLEAAEKAHNEAARSIHDLIDFLQKLVPNDIRNTPTKTSWRL